MAGKSTEQDVHTTTHLVSYHLYDPVIAVATPIHDTVSNRLLFWGKS